MTIQLEVEGFPDLAFAEMWSRSFRMGTAEGYVGAEVIVTVSRPFSPEENELFRWVVEQDGCLLFGIYNASDGRDVIVFERTYTKQSEEDAFAEQREHLAKLARRLGFRPVSLSR